MAGGLFAVYRDPTAVEPNPAASRRVNGSSSNSNNNNRKKDGFAVFRDSGAAGVNRALEKENLDPPGKPNKKAGLGTKAKKVPSGGKLGDCGSSLGPVKAVMGDRRVKRVVPAASTNGICTGSLTTRVLPPLPPLEPDSVDLPAPSPPRAATPLPTSSFVGQCGDSPASNVDSGYGKVSDGDLEFERGADFNDESDMSLDADDVVDARDSNRRARALTESPLAEITQAFTGLGGFSNAPASPSPAAFANRRAAASITAPTPIDRKRSSPSKSLSALPPRLRPYSTTATTRKVKPGQTAPDMPNRGPPSTTSRSLRF